MTYVIEIFKAFPKEKKKPTWHFILFGYTIALALYLVDEGNYHFDNLIERPIEWVFVSIYALILAGTCRIAYAALPASLTFRGRLALAALIGIVSIPVIVLAIALAVSFL